MSISSFYSSTPKLVDKYPQTARRIQYNQLDEHVKILVDKAENREIKLFKNLESTEITQEIGIFALEKHGGGKRTVVSLEDLLLMEYGCVIGIMDLSCVSLRRIPCRA